MLEAAKEKGIKYVMLNTNGVRIAREPEFARQLSRIGVVVYLQFDGFASSTFKTIRGMDLTGIKRHAIENLARFDVSTVLVSTVQRGVNENEMGAIVDYALETHIVRGVVFQPTFYTGRHPSFDPLDRVTLPDIVRGLQPSRGTVSGNPTLSPYHAVFLHAVPPPTSTLTDARWFRSPAW